ncbi:MAG: hypothetical protein PUD05_09535 [Lachnospiraceae bacterium]|jgi:hypothetical protein|nr:hypothetical protein [Lachnospiraceae bacterium]MCH4029642.1 hypothetical protein [Lachnospiraceae bacterium]MCH4067507.1 hypothetical protein [Lachnospiraceae bacterium]MCH4113530.1 hypothetical protein [Lachnospiraceae bacterium]MCI1353665.1 hypothetical protein [Lachnospiraceae bacterium]
MFSYDDYREIIRLIKASGRAADYEEALHRDSFIIMRHDVEYSVDRAYALSKVEESEDFHSTYFFQWTNNSYNILSRKNRDIVTDMHERGHNIGLHFALNGMTDMNLIREQIRKEMEMLSTMFGFEVKWFSIHRPSPAVLKENIKFPGIINAYQDNFFTFNPNVTADTPVEVKYLSDANHIWRYGYPDEATLAGHRKVQILIHPFGWTKEGYDNCENYRTLIDEKYTEMINSIDSECKDFAALRPNFEATPSELRSRIRPEQ